MAKLLLHKVHDWEYMAQRCNYRVGDLANQWHVSRRQLVRWSYTLFGRNPREWLREERLKNAIRKLGAQRCIKAVSSDLGFKQVSHFSREFKRQFGRSPAAFLASNESRLR